MQGKQMEMTEREKQLKRGWRNDRKRKRKVREVETDRGEELESCCVQAYGISAEYTDIFTQFK